MRDDSFLSNFINLVFSRLRSLSWKDGSFLRYFNSFDSSNCLVRRRDDNFSWVLTHILATKHSCYPFLDLFPSFNVLRTERLTQIIEEEGNKLLRRKDKLYLSDLLVLSLSLSLSYSQWTDFINGLWVIPQQVTFD